MCKNAFSVDLYVHSMGAWYWQRPEENARSLETGTTDSC